ncbi:hypothetical protein EON64_06520, partial [archaeon]
MRQDFELMCYNALLFNQPNDEYWIAAMTFLRQGSKLFDSLRRRTKPTAYFVDAQKIIDKHAPALAAGVTGGELVKSKGKKRSRFVVDDAGLVEEGDEPKEAVAGNYPQLELEQLNAQSVEKVVDVSASIPTTSSIVETLDDLNSLSQALQLQIPLALQPVSEPASYIVPTSHLLSADDVFFQAHNEACFICGSSGDQSDMLFCIDCGEAFHCYCANVPTDFLQTIQEAGYMYNWRCMNCKICEVCSRVNSNDADNLIFCEKCDTAYHTDCMTPPVVVSRIKSSSGWYCPDCVHCQKCNTFHVARVWGFLLDCCINCLRAEYLCVNCKADVQDSNGSYDNNQDSADNAESTSSLPGSFFTCEECGGKMHADCFMHSEYMLLVRTGRMVIRCSSCQKQHGMVEQSQHSSVWQRVQVLQLELQDRERLSDAAAMESALGSKMKEKKLYAIAMVVWATIRIMLINRGLNSVQGQPDAYLQFYRSSTSFPPQNASKLLLNTFVRARRFYNYFKRSEKLGTHSPMKAGQLLGVKLLDQDGHALSVLCNQAASFVYSSDLMQRNDIRRLSEALIVLVEAVLILSSQHATSGSPILTLSALNEAFECFTKVEFVQRLKGSSKKKVESNSVNSRYKDVRLSERDFELFISFATNFLMHSGGLQGANLAVTKEFIEKTYKASCRKVVEPTASLPAYPNFVTPAMPPRVYFIVNTLLLQGLEVNILS